MKKKNWLSVLLILCMLAGLLPVLTPHSFAAKIRTLSPWAEAEVRRADGYGLLDVGVLARYDHEIAEPMTDWRQPITRAEFARFALSYAAVMNHSDREGFQIAVNALLADYTPDGVLVQPFSDDRSQEAIAAHALGIVQGRGDGSFDPDALITRQEAATMLCRAYAVCAGASPEAEDAAPFADEAAIDAWALEAVHVLRGRNVLLGMGDGRFDPQGKFTIEQCAACFLRLGEQMPVSFLLGNVPHLFTQEQAISAVGPTERVQRWDGPLAVFLRRDQGTVIGDTAYFLVYADGGIRRLEAAVPTHSYAPRFDSAAFSADGKTFTYTMTLQKDDYDLSTIAERENGRTPPLLSEAGVYTVAVDVPSGAQSVTRMPLETGDDASLHLFFETNGAREGIIRPYEIAAITVQDQNGDTVGLTDAQAQALLRLFSDAQSREVLHPTHLAAQTSDPVYIVHIAFSDQQEDVLYSTERGAQFFYRFTETYGAQGDQGYVLAENPSLEGFFKQLGL